LRQNDFHVFKIHDMRSAIKIMAGMFILFLCGCSDYTIPAPEYPENIPENVSYKGDVQPIFDKNCATCHTGGQQPDLSPDWSYDELTQGGYVNTDDPLESTVYQIFSGTHDGRATEEETLVILGWIIEGAQNN
jgi:mono/diheme cytochrome c family protein